MAELPRQSNARIDQVEQLLAEASAPRRVGELFRPHVVPDDSLDALERLGRNLTAACERVNALELAQREARSRGWRRADRG